jgi:bromodomain-containing factor 1
VRTIKSLEANLKAAQAVAPFLYPVEELIMAIPEYIKVIRKPIDLHHIKNKLDEGIYEDITQLNADIKLMTSNAMKFNPAGHEVHHAAMQFQQIWEEKLRSCPAKTQPRDDSEDPLAGEFVDDDDESSDEDCKSCYRHS